MIHYSGTPTLETDRLVLRKIKRSDAQTVFDNWLSDDRVMDNLIKGAHKSVEETIKRVTEIVGQYETEEFCYW
ncbi:GNAT family N-acetyltransferase [Rossellomorea vietnamensis]|uniref:GNAT family N-acetyltransferase n=1 Tax=Rossellomorea vietnamensis TaxID=218284 RepID=UPI002078C3DC|nr:GNAT family N-acetyltransferase [Rossellomorea vietnamensis]